LIPQAKKGGRQRTTDMREVINGILYVLKGGIQWRLLPHDFEILQQAVKEEEAEIRQSYQNSLNDLREVSIRIVKRDLESL
jgi:transposase